MSATNARVIAFTPTLSLSAYTSGDQVGAVTALPYAFDPDNDSASVLSLVVVDKAQQKMPFDLLLFNDAPAPTSGDNDALAIPSADMAAKFLGRVSVEAADYTDLAGQSVASLHGIGLLLEARTGATRTINAVVQARATKTFTAADDLTIKLGLLQD